MDSPPKRMTRSRAAARASAATTKTTRVVTAAGRARSLSTATASTKSTSAKRKIRDEEKDDGDDELAGISSRRAVRARPDSRNETADCGTASVESVSRGSRFRAVRKTTAEVPASDHALVVGRTRGRAGKSSNQDPMPAAPKTDKKPAQTSVAAGTVSKPASNGSKLVTRKAVGFQRPGKENVSLASKAEEAPSTVVLRGLRGRPTRRATAVASAQPSGKRRKKPLSPKKVTQMPISRDRESSEDELSGGDGAKITARSATKIETSESLEDNQAEETSIEHGDDDSREAAKLQAGPGPVVFGSPPRRPPSSPPRETLKSPAKRAGGLHLPGLNLQARIISTAEQDSQTSPNHSNALLQSPAKRPPSPIKGLNFATPSFGSTVHHQTPAKGCSMLQSPAKRAMPGGVWSVMQHPAKSSTSPIGSPQMQPIMAAVLPVPSSGRPSDLLLAEESDDLVQPPMGDNPFDAPIENPRFSGRMSAVLPDRADSHFVEQAADDLAEYAETVWTSDAISCPAEESGARECPLGEDRPTRQDRLLSQPLEMTQEAEDEVLTNLQEFITEVEETGEVSIPSTSTEAEGAIDGSQPELNFQIQAAIVDPCGVSKFDADSEDDVSACKTMSVLDGSEGQRPSNQEDSIDAARRHSTRSTMGLISSAARQSGSWSATSTVQLEMPTSSGVKDFDSTFPKDDSYNPVVAFETDNSPVKSTFFEDEIMVHADFDSSEDQTGPQRREDASDDAISMEDMAMLDEDDILAQEANTMLPMLQKPDEVANTLVCEETLSEASQEYGDENEMPIEPTLARRAPHETATPARPIPQTAFCTTTKVPLKPADDSESSPLKTRSFSAGRVPSRFADISYSPTKEKRRASILPGGDPFSTPTKGDQRSSVGTPGNTPRRDVDPALLRGCVVLVDVHTTEGADASGIFIELLTHMGAKCVKTWHWNPSSSGNGDGSSSNVGITHVVFKDGGKRTMEKVREAGGLVHCVGVSWVLDCERVNEWLDEAPYRLDTSVIPRGGARRRKSMEPKAIANMNGTIVPSINKTPEPLGTLKNRRESTLWMHTPLKQGGGDDDDEEDLDWSCALLTPVPKTPAPEAVAKYVSELPVTPMSGEDSDLNSPTKQSLLMRTCPPKDGRYHDLEHGILSQDKDEQVVMRLMAARRKSLQFAPKIGSPLARTWN
ncbi:hypothetical protein E4U41_001553 [Claviceps citrina]|nr:hypothetical protein E4U41_001553 [Claviceps citrina]